MRNRPRPSSDQVRAFWQDNPLCTGMVDAEAGTPAFFEQYDRLRELNEPPAFARALHEYDAFPGGRVLEVGCGNAYTLARYAEHGASTFGLDITQAAVDISRRRFELRGLEGDFRVGSAEELPYESDFFDCICSMGVLHHVADTERAVEEIYRCLKPGGRLIIMMYHRNSFFYQVKLRWGALRTGASLQKLVNEFDGVGNPKGDVYSRAELAELLKRFTDLEMFAGYLQVPRLRIDMPSSMRNPIGRRIGWYLYAKGRKPRSR